MADLFNDIAPPTILQELNYETILAEMITDLNVRFFADGIDYDVGNLETDPLVIALQVVAYREVNLRARANDVARAQILSFSTGSDLEYLAAFYQVQRILGEEDAALRARIILAISGRSTAGPDHWYKFHAKSADIRVRDISIEKVGNSPNLLVTVLSTDNDGVADQPLLDAVTAAITSDTVRVVSDVLTVQPAVLQTVDIEADIYLLTGSPMGIFDALADTIRAEWDDVQSMGLDLSPSWITQALHRFGVYRVVLQNPSDTIIAESNRAISIGIVNLTFKGFAF